MTVQKNEKEAHKIKCVVWDLDNTIWNGVLLEDEKVTLRDGIVTIIKTLDNRGILQSISSKNDEKTAWVKLQEFGIAEYFLYPQINWNSKSSSVKLIKESINISFDTIAFIDDQIFERDEVKFTYPEVMCIDTADLGSLLDLPEMNPKFITEDSQIRRSMYMSDIARNKEESEFTGPQEEFLASLKMIFKISVVTDDDLQRAEELTVRTHQLNTTGYTYSYEELNNFRKSEQHKLMIASLDDKYGTYGKIGLILLECSPEVWVIKLLLMSCRVMSRGVGTILINHVMNLAKNAKVRLQTEFVANDRNRMMYVTFKFAGFTEVEERDGVNILENDLSNIQPFPEYVEVQIA